MTILDHYAKEKQRFLENCIQCGLCAEGCPILPYTEISEVSAQEIQEDVFDFMEGGIPNQQAYTKAFACMECFKCTAGMCPEDLNPMLINELIKGEYISRGLANRAYGDALEPDSTHRVLASVQVSASDYSKITKPSDKRQARYVFFPGCNVYFQPEIILNSMNPRCLGWYQPARRSSAWSYPATTFCHKKDFISLTRRLRSDSYRL